MMQVTAAENKAFHEVVTLRDGSARFTDSRQAHHLGHSTTNHRKPDSVHESEIYGTSSIYGMNRNSPRYPFAIFHSLPESEEAEFVDRVRLYGRAMIFLYAKEFRSITGATAQQREVNRLAWLRRTTSALENLCRVRSSFDDWASFQEPCADVGWSPARWACGFATLTSLIVAPHVIAAYDGIQEHCEHLSAFLNGCDQDVSIYSTDTNHREPPALQFSVYRLQSTRRPHLTPAIRVNIRDVAERHLGYTVGLFQIASSRALPAASVSRFRRCLAELALASPEATDAHKLLFAAMYGDVVQLTAVAQSIFQLTETKGPIRNRKDRA